MIPSGIEPVTFRFVAQYLKHCATISGPLEIIKQGEFTMYGLIIVPLKRWKSSNIWKKRIE
jgi:hypothetical protein